MVSNKQKLWVEAQSRGLIEDYVEYGDLTTKEIQAIIDSADEEEAVICTECGEDGVVREDGIILCDECYDELQDNTDPEKFYNNEESEEDDEPEEESEEEEEEVPEPEDEIPEEEDDDVPDPEEEEEEQEDVPEPSEQVPEVVETPVVQPTKPVPKKYIKITRNVIAKDIPVGTLVTFRCKPGSNIRNFAGDMSVGLVLKKRDGIKTYSGKLTKKLKKDIQLKKIILLR